MIASFGNATVSAPRRIVERLSADDETNACSASLLVSVRLIVSR
jgi:hypothetical protein